MAPTLTSNLTDSGVLVGEVQTTLLSHSTPLSAAEMIRSLSMVPGQRTRLYERPVRHARSPEILTGVDGQLPLRDRHIRAVGTVASQVAITGGRLVQATATANLVRAQQPHRMGWQHYLRRPGVLEMIGRQRSLDLAIAFLEWAEGTEHITFEAITGRLLDKVQTELDHAPPLRAPRTQLRWSARQGAEPRIQFSIENATLRSAYLELPEADLATAADFCEELALHDWLLTVVIAVLDRSHEMDERQMVPRLRPLVDVVVPLWMPAVRTSEVGRILWQSLDQRAGFTRQWETLVGQIRDRLDLAAATGLAEAAPTAATETPAIRRKARPQRRIAAALPLTLDQSQLTPGEVAAAAGRRRRSVLAGPRWVRRTWSQSSPGIRLTSVLMWSFGLALSAAGVAADAYDWWGERQFTVNLISSLAGASFGIPLALIVFQQLSAQEARRHQRYERVVQMALDAVDELVVTIRDVVLDDDTFTQLITRASRLTDDLLPAHVGTDYSTQIEEILHTWEEISRFSWDSAAEIHQALATLQAAEGQWWAFRQNLGPRLRHQGIDWADSPRASLIEQRLHTAQDAFHRLDHHDIDYDAVIQAYVDKSTQPLRAGKRDVREALAALGAHAADAALCAHSTVDLIAAAAHLQAQIRRQDMNGD